VKTLPLFPVTSVGSWPRPPEVRGASRQLLRGPIDRQRFASITDGAIIELLRLQEEIGCDIVTDGELRRDNFYSFVADKLAGVQLMTLAEMLDVVEDKAGFERLLQTLDVPAYSINSPICVGRIARRDPLVVNDLRVEEALLFYPPDKIFLNPDCGFGTFSGRPVNDSATASSKMRMIVAVHESRRVGGRSVQMRAEGLVAFLSPQCPRDAVDQ
jgi:methionine synthase II (cobalamin-independent)